MASREAVNLAGPSDVVPYSRYVTVFSRARYTEGRRSAVSAGRVVRVLLRWDTDGYTLRVARETRRNEGRKLLAGKVHKYVDTYTFDHTGSVLTEEGDSRHPLESGRTPGHNARVGETWRGWYQGRHEKFYTDYKLEEVGSYHGHDYALVTSTQVSDGISKLEVWIDLATGLPVKKRCRFEGVTSTGDAYVDLECDDILDANGKPILPDN